MQRRNGRAALEQLHREAASAAELSFLAADILARRSVSAVLDEQYMYPDGRRGGLYAIDHFLDTLEATPTILMEANIRFGTWMSLYTGVFYQRAWNRSTLPSTQFYLEQGMSAFRTAADVLDSEALRDISNGFAAYVLSLREHPTMKQHWKPTSLEGNSRAWEEQALLETLGGTTTEHIQNNYARMLTAA